MKLLRGSVWLQYLTSYLMVLALPFPALSVLLGNYARRASMERLSDSMRRTTDQIQSSFDIRMEQMNAIAGQISQRTEFDGISLSRNFAAYDVIRKALTGYVSTNLFCTEILYYNSSVPEVIFSSQGTYNPSYYRLLIDNVGEPQTLETYEWDQNRTGWVSSGQIINNRIQLPECLFYVIPLKNTHGGLLLFELSDVVIRKHLFENLPQGEIGRAHV